jgi:hypothetical protein
MPFGFSGNKEGKEKLPLKTHLTDGKMLKI